MPADTLTHFRRRRDGCRIQLSSSPALPSPQPQTGKEDGSPRLATARHCRSELELGVRTILLGMPSMPSPYFGISLHYSALCTLHSALSPPRPPPYPTHTHSPPHHSNNHQMHSNNTPRAHQEPHQGAHQGADYCRTREMQSRAECPLLRNQSRNGAVCSVCPVCPVCPVCSVCLGCSTRHRPDIPISPDTTRAARVAAKTLHPHPCGVRTWDSPISFTPACFMHSLLARRCPPSSLSYAASTTSAAFVSECSLALYAGLLRSLALALLTPSHLAGSLCPHPRTLAASAARALGRCARNRYMHV